MNIANGYFEPLSEDTLFGINGGAENNAAGWVAVASTVVGMAAAQAPSPTIAAYMYLAAAGGTLAAWMMSLASGKK